jgi:hypothetical protein
LLGCGIFCFFEAELACSAYKREGIRGRGLGAIRAFLHAPSSFVFCPLSANDQVGLFGPVSGMMTMHLIVNPLSLSFAAFGAGLFY